jgi:hypothetical protein
MQGNVTRHLAVPSTAIDEGVGLIWEAEGEIRASDGSGEGEMCLESGDETFQNVRSPFDRFDLVPFLFLIAPWPPRRSCVKTCTRSRPVVLDGAAIRATPLRHVKGVAKQGQGRQAASLATTQPKKQPKLKSRSDRRTFFPLALLQKISTNTTALCQQQLLLQNRRSLLVRLSPFASFSCTPVQFLLDLSFCQRYVA